MRQREVTGLGLAVASTLLVLGCSDGASRSQSSHPPTPSASRTPIPLQTRPQPNGDSGPALSNVVLSGSEVSTAGTPVTAALYRGGRSVTNQDTLDECHATYPSETRRAARIQVGYVANNDRDGAPTASNEVVRYRDGGAAQAYREITKALENCPAHFSDGGKAIGSHTTILARDPKLPTDQITATQRITIGTKRTWTAISFMYDGDLFSGVYVFRATRSAAVSADRILSKISAGKLIAAFDSEGTLI